MAVEVGQIVQGTVVKLLAYGVLVRLDEGSTGLVHISEIDQNYVRDVADYFAEGDPVAVKVLATGERGKIELSAKQARGEGTPPLRPRPVEERNGGSEAAEGPTSGAASGQAPSGGRERESEGAAPPRRESRASFEEKMGDFMRSSSERLGDLKRNIENKRGGKKAR